VARHGREDVEVAREDHAATTTRPGFAPAEAEVEVKPGACAELVLTLAR
jgi:hypothetical protein